jgi:surface antigen
MSLLKLAAAALVLTLAACAGSADPNGPGPKENTGTLFGALGGALVGSRVSKGPAGTLVGAGVGALIGNRIGAAMDDDDKQRAYAAQMQALDDGTPGAPVAWRNPDSGRYGMVVPGPMYEDQGRHCRAFSHTVYIDGHPETVRAAACRNPDGSWTPLG